MRKSWTKEEEEFLIKLKKKGLQYRTISKIMDRSQDSIRIKYWRIKERDKGKYEEEARILVLDIETSLMVFTGFRTGRQFIGEHSILDDFFILSWSAKWLNEEGTFGEVVKPSEAKRKDDKRILKKLWKLMDEADLIVGHNVDRFDIKKINTRFLMNDLGLPRKSKGIDTLKIARKTFSFSSNKLDYLARLLGVGGKLNHTGYDLWLDCLKGDKEALKLMLDYNIQDVSITEAIYHKLKEGLYNPPRRPRTGWKSEG